MSVIFGVIFALAGLALSVIFGMLLYPDKKQKAVSATKSLKLYEEAESS
jgi:uncharacterized membrane protein YciS (DUF1049 family)